VALAPGLYDLPLTEELRRLIDENVRELRATTATLDPADSNELLSRHVAGIVRAMLMTIPEKEGLTRQVEVCNQLLAILRSAVAQPPVAQTLSSVRPSRSEGHDLVTPATRLTSLFHPTPFRDTPPTEPGIPLSQSSGMQLQACHV
jgi:hypothetical protein